MPRFAAVVLAALALAGPAIPGAASSAVRSGLQGVVYRGPVRPVCEEGVPCDVPAPGVRLVFSRSGEVVKRVTSGARGRYIVYLAPGVYKVNTALKIGLGAFSPRTVRVPVGRVGRVDFYIDTGIR